jgi:hypothetical protein
MKAHPIESTAAALVRSLLPAPLALVFLGAPGELYSASGSASKSSDPSAALAAALAREDLPAVRAAVAAERDRLGDRAGEPEVPDEYRPVPKDATLLTRAEARRGFTAQFAALEKMRWWKVGVDPTALAAPLRGPASVIVGNVAVARAKLEGSERSLAIAKDAAEFLLWAQQQAGSGGFPFPAARGGSGNAVSDQGRARRKTGSSGA